MEQFRLHRPAVETALSSPTGDKEKASAAEGEAAGRSDTESSRRPFGRLLRFRAFESLQHREFRLIWFGQVFASMATWMDRVARGWLIYELTDSALQLGLVQGVQALPFLLLSPIAGSTADRYSRKMQMMIAQVADGMLYAALAVLIFTGRIQPWHVYVTAFGMAVVQAFQRPSRAAMIADAVPPGQLTNAIGLNAIVFNVARSTGPALAGVLIALFGTGGSYSVQAFFYILATYWTALLRPLPPASGRARGGVLGASHAEVSFGRSVIEGWKFSWKNEAVRSSLLVAMFASLFIAPFTTLLPVFARDLLGVGATGQGLLLTSMGIGALGSSVIIASFGDRLPRGLFMLGGVTLYGIIVMVFSVSPWFQLSIVLMAVVGASHVTSHALVQTVIQAYSPSEFRGRTMAIFQMNQVVLTVGSLLIGALSALLGARWAVGSMSAVGTLTMIAVYVALPRARLIR